MGRIKTKAIKRITLKLFRDDPEKFKEKFSENKKLVNELVEVRSKKFRNVIAGYLTRLVKQQK
jgi:small subunit ribosomal protein S17e